MSDTRRQRVLSGTQVGVVPSSGTCGLLIRRPQVRTLLGPPSFQKAEYQNDLGGISDVASAAQAQSVESLTCGRKSAREVEISENYFADYEACLSDRAPSSVSASDIADVLPGEEWRTVVGYEGQYDVSNLGRVRRALETRSLSVGRPLIQSKSTRGYLTVGLYLNRKQRSHTVHSLVAAAFIGPRPADHVINHINADKTCNSATNLEYVTQAENASHAARLGLNRFEDRRCGLCGGLGHTRRMCQAGAPS